MLLSCHARLNGVMHLELLTYCHTVILGHAGKGMHVVCSAILVQSDVMHRGT